MYSAIAGVRKDAKFGYALAVFNVVSWCVFPTAYFLHVSGRIDAARLDLGYAIGDAFAKFSCTMLYVTGCGRIMDLAEDEAAQRTDAQVAEQREYIRAVCAELKAPLDAIVGYGRMSADYDENGEKTPSQVRRFQRAILTSAESMRELVSQAAQYSKVHGEIHARGRMIGTGKEGEDVGLPRVAWRKEGGDSRAFPLPPMLPTPGRRFSRVSRESFDGDDETDPPSSVFTLGKLQDLVVKAANIPVGFELTCEISPPAATHTEHFRANTRLLRQALATLCETAAAQPSVVRRAGGVEAARARGAPPCVRLSASLGATRKMEIAPVIDPNDESRDESLETSDLPEWTDATFTASLILDRRVVSHPSDASNSGNPQLGVGVTPEERVKRRRLDLSTTVAKTVVTAMGGSLIRRQSDSMSGDASGDQFSFTVPLLRTSRDESECDFVPVMPLPPGRTVGAVLLLSLIHI